MMNSGYGSTYRVSGNLCLRKQRKRRDNLEPDPGDKGAHVTDDARALELYQLAQSVAEAKGRLVTVGLMTYSEYRQEPLSIRYFPSTDHLEVWHGRKMLNVNREHGQLKVRHYVPGEWEAELNEAAKLLK